MFNLKNLSLSFVIGGSLLCLGAAGFAQQAPKSPTDNQQTSVSDSDLKAFAKAYVENQKIRQKYEPSLGKTTDPEKYSCLSQSSTGSAAWCFGRGATCASVRGTGSGWTKNTPR